MGLDMFLGKTKKMDVEVFKGITNKVYGSHYDMVRENLHTFFEDQKAEELTVTNHQIFMTFGGVPLYVHDVCEGYRSFTATIEVGYWRKANAIHGWFVDVVQNGEDDCDYYLVTKEQIEELLNTCKSVLNDNNPSLLPTRSGFFFGGTVQDEWYYNYIKDTIDILEKVLIETDFENEMILYFSSW